MNCRSRGCRSVTIRVTIRLSVNEAKGFICNSDQELKHDHCSRDRRHRSIFAAANRRERLVRDLGDTPRTTARRRETVLSTKRSFVVLLFYFIFCFWSETRDETIIEYKKTLTLNIYIYVFNFEIKKFLKTLNSFLIYLTCKRDHSFYKPFTIFNKVIFWLPVVFLY